MSDLAYEIVGDAVTFTPQALIGIIMFVCVLEAICTLAGAMVSGVSRR